mgnify:CR=1 FL=1
MPCMYNGRPVKGNKGSCPSGSYWSDTEFDGELNEFADVTNFLKRRYTNEGGGIDYFNAITDPLLAIPVGGWGLKGALTAGKVGSKGIGSLINKLFMKKTPAVPAKTTTTLNPNVLKPNPVQAPHWGINAQGQKIKVPFKPGSQFKPYVPSTTRQTAAAIPAGMKPSYAKMGMLGAGGLYANEQFYKPISQRGQENMQARKDASLTATQTTQTNEQNVADANALAEQTALAEKQRVEGLGFFDRMKEPGYWDTSLTGVEGDDRMSRLGDLLRYYGMPPSGRANELSPSEQWAQRSIDAATVAAKEAANNAVNSQYSKIGNKTGIEAIEAEVKKDFGNTWLPFDVALGARLDDKEVEALAKQLHIAIVNLAQMPEHQGKNTLQLYEIAKKDYEKSVR